MEKKRELKENWPDPVDGTDATIDFHEESVATNEAILDASRKIAEVYAELMRIGLSEEAAGRAMIGAAIHIYDALDLISALPGILRRTAAKIELEFALPLAGKSPG